MRDVEMYSQKQYKNEIIITVYLFKYESSVGIAHLTSIHV